MDAATGIITTVAGNGTQVYGDQVQGGDGKLATAAAVWNPTGVVVDAAGNIYIAEPGASAIRRVDAASGIISTVAGNGGRFFSGDGGNARDATLNIPQDMVLTSGGQIVIADGANHILRIVNCSSPAGAPSRPALGLCHRHHATASTDLWQELTLPLAHGTLLRHSAPATNCCPLHGLRRSCAAAPRCHRTAAAAKH